jgi:hypothetical protein
MNLADSSARAWRRCRARQRPALAGRTGWRSGHRGPVRFRRPVLGARVRVRSSARSAHRRAAVTQSIDCKTSQPRWSQRGAANCSQGIAGASSVSGRCWRMRGAQNCPVAGGRRSRRVVRGGLALRAGRSGAGFERPWRSPLRTVLRSPRRRMGLTAAAGSGAGSAAAAAPASGAASPAAAAGMAGWAGSGTPGRGRRSRAIPCPGPDPVARHGTAPADPGFASLIRPRRGTAVSDGRRTCSP